MTIFDGRVVRHVPRCRDRRRDERLGGAHHVDVRIRGQEPLALLAAGIGAVEDRVVLGLQMRRTFQRHGPADVVVGRVDIRLGVAQVLEQVEGRVVQLLGRDAEDAAAEFLAQGPLVEDEADVEGAFQRGFDPGELGVAVAPPAIANALYSATGVRFRRLPLLSEGL